jgi:hypothetical protein
MHHNTYIVVGKQAAVAGSILTDMLNVFDLCAIRPLMPYAATASAECYVMLALNDDR